MLHTTPRPASSTRYPLTHVALALLLACGGTPTRADDGVDPFDEVPVAELDAAVAAALPPPLSALQSGDPLATTVVLATRLDTSSAAVGDANRPAEVPLVKPTPRPPTSTAARPIPVERASVTAPASQLRLVKDQAVELHADGMPAPNAPSDDPFERVLPRAVEHNSVVFGARWGAQDKLALPLAGVVAVSAQADMLAGAPSARANAVRRSLRLVAQWDDFDSLVLGLAPGWTRGGGSLLEHHVTGVQASTLDPARAARWRSFLEVSGEKISPDNIYANPTAQLRAGATYQSSTSTQLDLSVTRGAMDKPDTQSSVGLSVKF